jgi:hypothetical protein
VNRQDWTLLTIAAAKEKGLSPVQLQKSLFLLQQKYRKQVGSSFYNFVPYNYGPFDANVYSDAERLASAGLIIIDRHSGRGWPEYRISSSGLREANRLREDAPHDASLYLQKLVAWVHTLSFQQLVGTIYRLYPKYKQNSVFNG